MPEFSAQELLATHDCQFRACDRVAEHGSAWCRFHQTAESRERIDGAEPEPESGVPVRVEPPPLDTGAAGQGKPCKTRGCVNVANSRYSRGYLTGLCEEVCIPLKREEMSARARASAKELWKKRREQPPDGGGAEPVSASQAANEGFRLTRAAEPSPNGPAPGFHGNRWQALLYELMRDGAIAPGTLHAHVLELSAFETFEFSNEYLAAYVVQLNALLHGQTDEQAESLARAALLHAWGM